MRRVVAILVLIAAAAAAWFAWTAYSQRQQASAAAAASGTVETEEVAVAALTTGRIVKVEVTEGERVRKGDVLVRLDDEALRNQLAQTQAQLRAARANYIQVRDDGDSSDAQVDAARAQFDQARIGVKTAKLLLSYATVEAPADGVATSVAADPGEIASTGQALVMLSDLRDLKVSVFVPETEIGDVRVGDKASVTTDSSDETFDGKVTFVASQAEFTPANIETREQRVKLVYEVRLSVSDPSGTLKPGMPVDVEF